MPAPPAPHRADGGVCARVLFFEQSYNLPIFQRPRGVKEQTPFKIRGGCSSTAGGHAGGMGQVGDVLHALAKHAVRDAPRGQATRGQKGRTSCVARCGFDGRAHRLQPRGANDAAYDSRIGGLPPAPAYLLP